MVSGACLRPGSPANKHSVSIATEINRELMASDSLGSSYISTRLTEKEAPDIPIIEDDERLVDVVRKLSK